MLDVFPQRIVKFLVMLRAEVDFILRAVAVRWLAQAEAAAPQRVRNSAAVHETVAFLLGRARAAAGGPELRGMAARMGVPH